MEIFLQSLSKRQKKRTLKKMFSSAMAHNLHFAGTDAILKNLENERARRFGVIFKRELKEE